MMKAAIYYGKNDIRVEEKPMPVVGPTDVLVRNLRGGICGTDINIVKVGQGDMGISLGSEFGHEMVGEVVEIGSDVASEIHIGMRVGINPITAKKSDGANRWNAPDSPSTFWWKKPSLIITYMK